MRRVERSPIKGDVSLIVKGQGKPVSDKFWQPIVGQETWKFLQHVVPDASHTDFQESAASVLGRGISPNNKIGQQTGLVVGYVQSGKTMSFESVIALARDNGFQMVVVLAGTSTPLLEQSAKRVRHDLQLDDHHSHQRRWIYFKNPEKENSQVHTLRDAFENWRDEGTPSEHKQTVLVTVLKHHKRLENLIELLQAVGMDKTPVLVIDDEADQASLNTEVLQGEESTTYRRLMQLRDALPLHSYLQYTATPQAPLLISILDSLSPNFVEVLTPGDDYVGGQDFFEGKNELVRMIPLNEVPTKSNALIEPPASLLEALCIFMVGVAIGIKEGGDRGNRSMLVHPSHLTVMHQQYIAWVRDIFEEWKRVLNLHDTDPDRQELIEDLRVAYSDLGATEQGTLPEFDELAKLFRTAFRKTRLLEVNSRDGSTPQVDWSSTYGWILVGGQAMDRGFTVEGLTVTYMPRGIGIGNADTVQQRARFFGYKRKYLDLCRVYMEQETLYAFQRYVDHEKFMRDRLKEFSQNGDSLNDWKRAFILDKSLRPCRDNVLELGNIRGNFSDEWMIPSVVLASDDVLQANRQIVKRYVEETDFANSEGHKSRTTQQIHQVANDQSLQVVMEQLLIPIRITNPRDSQRFTGLHLQLSRALDADPNLRCTVYRMSPETGRRRSINEHGEVPNLFQGKAPVEPPEQRGKVYPGDRNIRTDNQVSIQIHTLDLTRDGKVEYEKVVVVAVWVPRSLGQGWLVQE